MSDPILHIKDSFYFEVPAWLAPSHRESLQDFPNVWIRLDPDFQLWEAKIVHAKLAELSKGVPSESEFVHDWEHWQHEPGNHGKPVRRYLQELAEEKTDEDKPAHPWAESWPEAQQLVSVQEYRDTAKPWSPKKIEAYNEVLSGKIIIPQPFGELRNLYQKDSGFCISRFMVLEMFVALMMVLVFTWYASRLKKSVVPKGRVIHLLDAFVCYLRDSVIRPGIGHGADKFVPILLTMFFFVLGCNLLGMIPWLGAPTASFSVTLSLAFATLLIGMGAGALKFGPIGVWLNLVPHMDLPLVIGIPVKLMLFVIEVLGLFIKHGVLGVRLLANMVAGHVVLLGIVAMGVEMSGWSLVIAGPIIVFAAVLFSCLELFVAFLQAYIFTFLSSLFIGASTHHH
ncbi:F0F1 ATP synthase subunit A [Blastopirellula sp. JC732]|uniref:ATP synthase subunit a n=1 Tax=Blastopirellula sediminis TaxID=2894196 RepID=A0A9X1MTQ9_9BACT|nr:F0F1 ATP synthase subunit A [Blastopirellula sediminis]MCC9605271.1 F0F1 ATP synthase subunit A [Blastopirellula sediminis]MCC9631429.1 F0F1 ATP synthase subunit A [Blastopirellula sediminis]